MDSLNHVDMNSRIDLLKVGNVEYIALELKNGCVSAWTRKKQKKAL